jgi:hypothetical protein
VGQVLLEEKQLKKKGGKRKRKRWSGIESSSDRKFEEKWNMD